MKKPFVSIVIPVKEINDFLRKETIPALLEQSYQDFELIILPYKASKEKFPKTKIIPSWPKRGPADKRDLGAKKAKGDILAFLDDDSYPQKEWLKNAINIFQEQEIISGVCGPSLTPSHNNLRQKASGYVWSTWLGSAGGGTYRCAIFPRREVDDFPTVNLLVKKKDFMAAGGFSSRFWPGEDTQFCLNLTKKLKKKIIYDPGVLVFHHRREVFRRHLEQISRYALHRGHFARILPQTSFRFGYFVPSFFSLGFLVGPVLILILGIINFSSLLIPLRILYFISILSYIVLLLATAFSVFLKEKNMKLSLMVITAIFLTHLVYGFLFIKGFLIPRLKSKYLK